MIQISRPALVFDKQKIYRTQSDVEKKALQGIEGKDGNKIMVLFSSATSETLQGEERTQLLKILTACKLKEDDVILVNAAVTKNSSLKWLRKNFQLHTLIVFGEIEISKNLALKKYHTYHIDGLQIIKSEPIAKLIKSAPDKKALWEELKGVFKIE